MKYYKYELIITTEKEVVKIQGVEKFDGNILSVEANFEDIHFRDAETKIIAKM